MRNLQGCRGIPRLRLLAICRESDASFFLFFCDAAWRPIRDTWHEGLDEARAQADFEFTNLAFTNLAST